MMPLLCDVPERESLAEQLAEKYGFLRVESQPQDGYFLWLTAERLCLVAANNLKALIFVDWVSGAAKHRRDFGGGRGQPIARAMGLKAATPLTQVVDATAGMGGDSFVLASLGCTVTMIERSPVAAALLEDGLQRALADPATVAVAERVTLLYGDAIALLPQLSPKPQAILVDPMFPDTNKKSAAAKKEMQAFQTLMGGDLDAPDLLKAAMLACTHRVVVKRPRLAAAIEGVPPFTAQIGQSTRFDIYSVKALLGSAGVLD